MGARVVESGPGGLDLAADAWQRLEALPDPRSPQGRIYPLACLIAIAVCAFTAAGNDRFTAVGHWIKRAGQADLARLRAPWDPLAGRYRAPDEKTIRVVLDRLDPRALLHMLAYPEAIPGTRLAEELGVPRAAVDVLIGKATNLDLPLAWAARSNRVEYVRLLLGAGADPGTRTRGTTPLENAIYQRQHAGRRPARRTRNCPAGSLDLCRVRPAGSCPGLFRCGRQAAAGRRDLAPQPRRHNARPAPDPGDRRSGGDHRRGVRPRLPARPDRGRALVP
ncbi:MAG TPA: transposase family protein [Streptosporangiaceae bacterium]